jgi:uncharacterized repeat protein (TIGR03806 family)
MSSVAFRARAPLAIVAALSVVLGACSGGSGGSSSSSFGLTQRVVVQGLAFPPTQTPGQYAVVDPFPFAAAGGIAIASTQATPRRIYTAAQSGFIESVDLDQPDLGGAVQYLDISDRVVAQNEAGLIGFAFHPDYVVNGHVFVHYVTGSPLRSRVSRFTRNAANPLTANPDSEIVIFERARSNLFHCGGMLAFGPDGFLYLSLGDDQVGANAQDVTSPFGKILRLNANAVNTPAPNNPFAGHGGDSAFVWAMGLRNTWKFSFDRQTGEMWGADVGEQQREEINRIVAGGNYGWPYFEGELPYDNPQGLPYAQFIAPIHTYSPSLGQAITGGYVYRGTESPSLWGSYVFGDYVAGRIWALVWNAATQTVVEVREIAFGTGALPTFGEDAAGELWFSGGGELLTLEETQPGSGATIPPFLSQTGIFANLATLETVPGIVPYDVVSPLWSDGAAKRRWIALPGMEQIAFHPTDPWTFPDGTVFVKHFELELAVGGLRRLETRVLWVHEGQWQGVTYRWNDAQTDAELLNSGQTMMVEVVDPFAPGGTLSFAWQFPSPANCLECHNGPAGRALGVNTPQLNKTFQYGSVADNQLRAWNNIQLFTTNIGPPTNPAFAKYVDPADTTKSSAERARSYLASNCAGCHRQDGPYAPFLDFDLRAGIPVSDMKVVGVNANYTPPGFAGTKRIEPFDPASSILWQRMHTLNPFFRMPPLGSNRRDELGLDVVGTWIQGGAGE